MKNIFLYIKNKWLPIMIGITLILIAFNALMIRSPGYTPNPSPTPVDKIASYEESITPGKSTEDDLRSILGTPNKTTNTEGKVIDEFKATTGSRTHTAILEGNKLTFFKEIVTTQDKKTSTDIKNIYGQAPYVMYEPYPHSTFNLYVYPQNGIAYLGHKDGGLLEIWYFEPTTFEIFRQTWGREYLVKTTEERSQ